MSVLKINFKKLPPKAISYRYFSNYDQGNFIKALTEVLNKCEDEKHLWNDQVIKLSKYALRF